MNANCFRMLYDYHFALNHKIWDDCIAPMTDEQFTQEADYSLGTIRSHVVHLMSVDERWFCGLRGVDMPGFLNPADFPSRDRIREQWDAVEADMRAYLHALTDDDLQQPFAEGMRVWQALFHVLNHATDHRAQMLAALHRLGLPTFPQDYFKFIAGQL